MAVYNIPKYKFEELQKQINKLRNKGANITFQILNDDALVPFPELGDDVNINCVEVEVEGTYIINGWRFVAVIEHASPLNIIRLADHSLEGQIPERYRTADKECEHCHIRRDRNDTFLVYNETENEWKQVGRTCLKSYTNGLDSEVCAQLASVINNIENTNNELLDGNFRIDPAFSSVAFTYNNETVKKKAYKYVQSHGYTVGVTPRQFNNDLNNLTDLATDREIEEVTEWLNNCQRSDWQQNALAAWLKNSYEFRDAGLITSTVSVYFKNKAREEAERARLNALQNNPANEYAGQVGDEVRFTIASFTIPFYRQIQVYPGGSYPVYKMIGTDGKTYIWGCSNDELEINVGDILKGKIKKLNEFRGQKQTEVSRCKIIGHENPQPVNQRPFRFR